MTADLTVTTTETSIPPLSSHPTILIGQGFWPRAGAYMLDTCIVLSLIVGTTFVSSFVTSLLLQAIGVTPKIDGLERFETALGLGAPLLYFILTEWIGGASPGKLLLGMRVVQHDGRPCSLGAALIRGLLRFVDGSFFTVPAMLSMRAPLNQRLGDRAAHTLVIHSRSLESAEVRPWWWVLPALLLWIALLGMSVSLLLLIGSVA